MFVERDPQAGADARSPSSNFDLLIVSLSLASADGLRLCSQVRSLDRTRHLPIIMLVEPGDEARLLRGLDMGVNDYLMRPIDRNEMLARVKTQIKRKRHSDLLRDAARGERRAGDHRRAHRAAQSPLHGKPSARRWSPSALPAGRAAVAAGRRHRFLQAVNDTYGHDVGDKVLKEFAARFRRNTRGIDLACRLGGEEFVIIMPDTDIARALSGRRAAARLHRGRAVPGQRRRRMLAVTASVGVATLERADDTPETMFKRADNALYAAKREGRNRVVADAA